MAITVTLLDQREDNVDGTTIASASVDPADGSVVYVVVMVRNMVANADPGTPTVVGGGSHAYTHINGTVANTRRRISVFRAQSSSYTAGAITATYAGNVRGAIQVVEFTGDIDTSGTNGSGSVVQSAVNAVDGTDTSGTVSLAAFGSADNLSFGAFWHLTNAESISPGTGYTEIGEVLTTAVGTIQSEYKVGDDDPDASWATGAGWGAVGIEVKAAASTAPFKLPELSMPAVLARY